MLSSRGADVARSRFSLALDEQLRWAPRSSRSEPSQFLRVPASPALARLQRGGAGNAGKEEDGSTAGARAAQSAHRAAIPTK